MENWKIILIVCCFILVVVNILIGVLLVIKHLKDINKINEKRYGLIKEFHKYRRSLHF